MAKSDLDIDRQTLRQNNKIRQMTTAELEKQFISTKNRQRLVVEDFSIEKEITKTLKERNRVLRELGTKAANLNRQAQTQREAQEAITKATDAITDKLDFLPSFLTEDIGKGLQDVGFEAAQSSDDLAGIFLMTKKLRAGFSALSLKTKIAFGVITAIVVAALAIFRDWDETLVGIVRDLGLTRTSARDLTAEIRKTGLELARFGISFEDVGEVGKALVEEFGTVSAHVLAMVKPSVIIAQSFSITGQEVSKLAILSGGIAKNLEQMALFIKSVAGATGVAAGQIARDIAESSELVAKFSGAGLENIIKSAAMARKLGVELGIVLGIAESLLDIEESTTKAVEAQLLLGTRIRITQARLLALNNDTAGATRILLEDLSSIHRISELTFFQVEALAGVLNVSAVEAKHMLHEFQKSKIELSVMDMKTREIFQAMTGIGSLAQSLELGDARTLLSQISSQIKFAFLPLLEGLLSLTEITLKGIRDLFTHFGKFEGLGKIGIGILSIVTGGGIAFALLKLIKLPFKILATGLGKVATSTSVLSKATSATSLKGLFGMAGAIILITGALIGLILATTKLVGVLGPAIGALSGFGAQAAFVTSLLGTLTIGFVGFIAMIKVLGVVGATAGIGLFIVGGAFLAIGASIFIAGKGIQFASDGLSSMGDAIENLKFDQLTKVALGIASIGIAAHISALGLIEMAGAATLASATTALLGLVGGRGIRDNKIQIIEADVKMDGHKVGQIIYKAQQGKGGRRII